MIVLDVETTGLNPQKNAIVSIAAMDFSNPKNFFYEECRIWEGAEITQEALNVNGFTHEQVVHSNKKSQSEILTALFEWMAPVSDQTIAGQNVHFDLGFLNASLEREKLANRVGKRIVDMHSLAYTHCLRHNKEIPLQYQRSNLNTTAIFKLVGLPSQPSPHHALTDVKMTAEAISRLVFQKNLLEEFKDCPIV